MSHLRIVLHQTIICLILTMAPAPAIRPAAYGQDWPMWGGSPLRNNAPDGTNIPTDWEVGKFDRRTEKWDRSTARNIKWVARLGSQTYGNPVVADGRVFVGTNNHAGYVKRYPREVDLGCLLCFRESDGEFLWQFSSEKLPTGRVHDWPLQGICSAPLVEQDRMWFVSNRGEVVCLDTQGFYDNEDDGPLQGEWGTLWRTPTTVSRGLMLYRVVDELQAAINAAGLDLPAGASVKRRSGAAQWELYTGNWKTPKIWAHIVRDGELIEVYRAVGQNESAERPLCSVADRRFEELYAGRLPQPIRIEIEKLGFTPESDLLRVVVPDKEWRISVAGGERRCEMRIRRGPVEIQLQKPIDVADKREADVVWKYNMMDQLGVSQHNMATCAPAAWGNNLFICTSNGLDESHINLPAPDAPSFIALDKHTGKLLWTDKSPGKMILHGQWSAPAVGVLGGVPQVIFPGGDGWVYSFRADRFEGGRPEPLWRFDGNPKDAVWRLGGQGTRNNIVAIPVIHDGLVYVVMGQDPEHGEGQGRLWCIDPTRRGDVSQELVVTIDDRTRHVPRRRVQAIDASMGEIAIDNPNSAVVWQYSQADRDGDGKVAFEEEFHRSIGSVAIKNGLLFTADFAGLAHCLDAKTGELHWTCDMLAQSWTSPLIVEDRIYMADEDGDVAIFQLSADPAGSVRSIGSKKDSVWTEPIQEINMGSSVYTAPIVANSVLFIATKDRLFAIARDEE